MFRIANHELLRVQGSSWCESKDVFKIITFDYLHIDVRELLRITAKLPVQEVKDFSQTMAEGRWYDSVRETHLYVLNDQVQRK